MKPAIHLNKIHHISIICSDYNQSKVFYTELLGLKVLQEIYRSERDSYKLDLSLHGQYVLELFSFPSPPPRPSFPEACGLRHLAFEVDDIEGTNAFLKTHGYNPEAIRKDEHTHIRFMFMQDPDGLPIEFYER
jgi:glyoxylase I family protein